MSRIVTVYLFYLIAVNVSWAQEGRAKFFEVEAGASILGVEVFDHEYIRAENAFMGTEEKNLRGMAGKFYAGIRTEIQTANNKYGFSAGLRFTQVNSSLGKQDYWTSLSDNFYFDVSQTTNTIEYLRLKEIKETSNFIGIPLGLTIQPFGANFTTIYFKGVLEFNYRLNTKTEVTFVDDAMNQSNDAIVKRLGAADNLSSIFTANVGFRFGKNPKRTYTIEMGPSAFLNERTSTIVETQGGFGAQVSIQFSL
jgi:hypothetical protein